MTFDRLKQFNRLQFIKYKDVIDFDKNYIKQQKKLLERLSKYNVKFRDQKLELDYSKRKVLNRQRIRKGKRSKTMVKRLKRLRRKR